MLNIENFLTYIENEEDINYLKSTLFDVNMRLFNDKKNIIYRSLVQNACAYIKFCSLQTMEGYKKPHGMSGANVAIPWNIIGVVRNRNTSKEFCQIMINPFILETKGEAVESLSNCGSIRLKYPIPVPRHSEVTVEYYDENGDRHEEQFNRANQAFTIQHEIDHNNGRLITDYEQLPF